MSTFDTDSPTFRALGASAVRKVAWAPASVILIHVIASKGFQVYDHYPWFDNILHLMGGVAISYSVMTVLTMSTSQYFFGSTTALTRLLLAVALTVCAALAWECTEWFSDRFFGTDALGGVDDTLKDMVVGCAGGLLFAAIYVVRHGRDQ